MLSVVIDNIVLALLLISAVVLPIWCIVTDKKKYITPKKKDQFNGSAQDHS